MKIGLLGCGTVGGAFYALAAEQKDVHITRLLSLTKPEGVVCPRTQDFEDILNDPEIDTVVELMGGLHPAYEFVTAALKRGKNVVTANKWLICEHYSELISLAEQNRTALRCTAAAGGGIPWLHSLERLLPIDEITAISGIMNGTTNYILSQMTENGLEYQEALQAAQRLGYAEADPTADVEGYDVRRKLVISANIAFGVSLRERDVPCIGITGITAQDIAAFKRLGLVCKLIAYAKRGEGGISASVEPMLFPVSGQLAHVSGPDNLIMLNAVRVGRQSFSGAGAGGFPTASNVLADCLEISRGCSSFYTLKKEPAALDHASARRRYYLRDGEGARTLPPIAAAEAAEIASDMKKAGKQCCIAALAEERDIC